MKALINYYVLVRFRFSSNLLEMSEECEKSFKWAGARVSEVLPKFRTSPAEKLIRLISPSLDESLCLSLSLSRCIYQRTISIPSSLRKLSKFLNCGLVPSLRISPPENPGNEKVLKTCLRYGTNISLYFLKRCPLPSIYGSFWEKLNEKWSKINLQTKNNQYLSRMEITKE